MQSMIHSLPPYPVNLSYHWIDSAVNEPVVFDGLRTPLNFPIRPGSLRSLQAKCQAPSQFGDFILRFALVQEQHVWFDQPPFRNLQKYKSRYLINYNSWIIPKKPKRKNSSRCRSLKEALGI